MIEVEVEGETFNGLPHGLCFIYFNYNGELHLEEWMRPKKISETDPYLDGSDLSFRGFGVFNSGVLSDGPSFFIAGDGHSIA